MGVNLARERRFILERCTHEIYAGIGNLMYLKLFSKSRSFSPFLKNLRQIYKHIDIIVYQFSETRRANRSDMAEVEKWFPFARTSHIEHPLRSCLTLGYYPFSKLDINPLEIHRKPPPEPRNPQRLNLKLIHQPRQCLDHEHPPHILTRATPAPPTEAQP